VGLSREGRVKEKKAKKQKTVGYQKEKKHGQQNSYKDEHAKTKEEKTPQKKNGVRRVWQRKNKGPWGAMEKRETESFKNGFTKNKTQNTLCSPKRYQNEAERLKR